MPGIAFTTATAASNGPPPAGATMAMPRARRRRTPLLGGIAAVLVIALVVGAVAAVKSWGQALAKRFCHRKATVAVTRKLAVIMHAMWVAALSFKVGVDDPRRFARSRTVGAHFGLTPRRHQSGTSIDYEGRISKQGDVYVLSDFFDPDLEELYGILPNSLISRFTRAQEHQEGSVEDQVTVPFKANVHSVVGGFPMWLLKQLRPWRTRSFRTGLSVNR